MRAAAHFGPALALGLGLAMTATAVRAATAPSLSCPPDDQAMFEAVPLPHFAAALKPGGTLNVLAVGSAIMFGPQTSPAAEIATIHGAPAPTASSTGFPWQMAHALEAGMRGLHVAVTVIGGHGLTADALRDKMRAEITRHPYRLVIWQTGTVDAVDMVPPEDFYQTLVDGAARIAASGADLVLVDPQYSRFLDANANVEPYGQALQAAGTLPGVALFHRFDLMRDWADSGALDLERAGRNDRPAVAVRLHACLGRALARMLMADSAVAE